MSRYPLRNGRLIPVLCKLINGSGNIHPGQVYLAKRLVSVVSFFASKSINAFHDDILVVAGIIIFYKQPCLSFVVSVQTTRHTMTVAINSRVIFFIILVFKLSLKMKLSRNKIKKVFEYGFASKYFHNRKFVKNSTTGLITV